jgi:LCP family protein required for cell wall assembly
MIVASVDLKAKDVVFTSIPRDYMVQIPGRGFNKINAVYAYAEADNVGAGGPAAIAAAEKITGLAIPYYATIDFKGFVKAVDHVGGLDITIDRTFTDSSYPNYNYGYLPPVTFTKGFEHMSGERALIFARSRKGTNGEGSDFARSERQKKIMVAMRDKLLQLNLSDLSTVNNLLGDFTENFRTNFEPYELKRLATLAKDISGDNAFSTSLDPDNIYICDGLVNLNTGKPAAPLPKPVEPAAPASANDGTGTPEGTDKNGAAQPAQTPPAAEPNSRIYVVQPCAGVSQTEIANHLMAMINVARLQKEAPTIEVQNSTGQSAALAPWKALSQAGIDIKFTTSKTPLEKSILYDNSAGGLPKTRDYLNSNFTFTASDLPYTGSKADFVIILGNDAL